MYELFESLFLTPSVTQTMLVLTFTIAIGVWMAEHLKVKQFSLGVTWILFAGIFLSALGIGIDHTVAHFAKEFGLILFVYSIGLQVGPSFGASFGKGGLQLNMLAAGIVLLGCLCAVVLHFITGVDMATMIGVMSGAVTNTPSLGAAQQAFADRFGFTTPDIATGYAVAYPLGVLGIIGSIMMIRWICRVSLPEEEKKLQENMPKQKEPICVDITLNNPRIQDPIGVKLLKQFCPVDFVVSRVIYKDGTDSLCDATTRFQCGDTLRFLTDQDHMPTLSLLGEVKEHKLKSDEKSGNLISRKIVVTKEEWNGKRIGNLNLRTK